MANEKLARRYATAIFSLASEANAVAAIGVDLHVALEALDNDDQIRRFFRSPVVDRKDKIAVLENALRSLHEIALNAVLLLVRRRRESIFGEIVAQYALLEQRGRGGSALRIESARALDPGELAALVDQLSRRYNTLFDVTQTIDPALIGGIRITMGDRLIDGSIAGKLDELARLLSTN